MNESNYSFEVLNYTTSDGYYTYKETANKMVIYCDLHRMAELLNLKHIFVSNKDIFKLWSFYSDNFCESYGWEEPPLDDENLLYTLLKIIKNILYDIVNGDNTYIKYKKGIVIDTTDEHSLKDLLRYIDSLL